MQNSRVIPAFLGMLCALILVGCQPKNEEDLTQVLRMGNGVEPETLDPHKSTSTSALNVQMALFEGLFSPDPKTLDPSPAIVGDWTISEDGLRYGFELRKGLVWSDNVPINAQTIVQSWERLLNPETASTYASTLFAIKNAELYHRGEIKDFSEVGIKEIATNEIEVILNRPTPHFLKLLLHPSSYPVPVHFIKAMDEQKAGDWSSRNGVPSSGPFKLESWSRGQKIKASKNRTYWDHETVKLEALEFWIFDDVAVEERAFLSGQIDVTDALPPARIGYYRDRKSEFLRLDPYLGVYYLLLNHDHPLLGERSIRRALTLAIDRDAIVEHLLNAGETVADSFTPSLISGYRPPSLKEIINETKHEVASETIFANANLEYLYNSSESHRRIAEAIQNMWRESLGMDLLLTNQEWRVYLDRRALKDFDIARAVWIGDYVEPSTFLNLWRSDSINNWISWSNQEYDALMEKADKTLKQNERYALYAEAEKILLADFAIIPIYHYVTAYLIQPKVKGWQANVLDWHPYKYLSIELKGENTDE